MTDLATRSQHLQARIRRACQESDRDPRSVELLPVSKRQPNAAIQDAARLGFSTFGENYVQEGSRKAQDLPGLNFVLIGPLQRNKVKPALMHFQSIMTVDRVDLVQRLRQLANELNVTRKIWLQVDLWDEATKIGGCPQDDIPKIIESLEGDARLPLEGFLAIPPAEVVGSFQDLARLREKWQQHLGTKLRLSMGMSEDLEEAISAGADQIRIGTALFGDRM